MISHAKNCRKLILSVGIRLLELVTVKKLGFGSKALDKLRPLSLRAQHVVCDRAQIATIGFWREYLVRVVSYTVEEPAIESIHKN